MTKAIIAQNNMKFNKKQIGLFGNIVSLIGVLLFVITKSFLAIAICITLASLIKFNMSTDGERKEISTQLIINVVILIAVIVLQIIKY